MCRFFFFFFQNSVFSPVSFPPIRFLHTAPPLSDYQINLSLSSTLTTPFPKVILLAVYFSLNDLLSRLIQNQHIDKPGQAVQLLPGRQNVCNVRAFWRLRCFLNGWRALNTCSACFTNTSDDDGPPGASGGDSSTAFSSAQVCAPLRLAKVLIHLNKFTMNPRNCHSHKYRLFFFFVLIAL